MSWVVRWPCKFVTTHPSRQSHLCPDTPPWLLCWAPQRGPGHMPPRDSLVTAVPSVSTGLASPLRPPPFLYTWDPTSVSPRSYSLGSKGRDVREDQSVGGGMGELLAAGVAVGMAPEGLGSPAVPQGWVWGCWTWRGAVGESSGQVRAQCCDIPESLCHAVGPVGCVPGCSVFSRRVTSSWVQTGFTSSQ